MSELADHALAARLLSLLDLTSLGEDDTPASIEALCASALGAPVRPAAICVYPEHVASAATQLESSGIRIATVINFPDGGSDPQRVARETRRALAVGADEIDMVLPHHALRRGDRSIAQRVVHACRDACSAGVVLKLIVETGELGSDTLIREACDIGLRCNVDFLKTSTGKAAVGATPHAATIMLESIAEAGGGCGFKAAGGIRRIEDATVYLQLAESRLGVEWVNATNFRIGASTLFHALSSALGEPR